MPTIRSFTLDASKLAPVIYKSLPHETTSTGLVVEPEVQEELEEFLAEFLHFVGSHEKVYLRVDAFPNGANLDIIEINVECREGWGIALNLLASAGEALDSDAALFLPSELMGVNDDYLPEFELAKREAERYGHALTITPHACVPGETFNDKLYLAEFSRVWRGKRVRVPPMYARSWVNWGELPDHVVFKFRDKNGPESRAARFSVTDRASIGKGTFVRSQYERGNIIGQHRIGRFLLEDQSVAQAIFMCAANGGILAKTVTGYLQVAPPETFIINDRTAKKGPLVLMS